MAVSRFSCSLHGAPQGPQAGMGSSETIPEGQAAARDGQGACHSRPLRPQTAAVEQVYKIRKCGFSLPTAHEGPLNVGVLCGMCRKKSKNNSGRTPAVKRGRGPGRRQGGDGGKRVPKACISCGVCGIVAPLIPLEPRTENEIQLQANHTQ